MTTPVDNRPAAAGDRPARPALIPGQPSDGTADTRTAMVVRFVAGESYEIAVRDHLLLVDQPLDAGGADAAPTPTELFVAALASCVAFYAGRYLSRHGYRRDGLSVTTAFDMATERPTRVASIRLTVAVPADLPRERWAALQAVVEHCTVHNSLVRAPDVAIALEPGR